MTECKACMLTGIFAALAAAAVTTVLLSGSNAKCRHLRHSVNRTVKQLNRAMDAFS